MKRCAFLTLDVEHDFVIDDELAYEPLQQLGWQIEAVPWDRSNVAWNHFDAVVIRSPWDYQYRSVTFLDVLRKIEQSDTLLFNDLELVEWNLRKTYLRDLENRGVSVVPTIYLDRLEPGHLPGLFDEIDSDKIVVKPVVGAGAIGAFPLTRHNIDHKAEEVEAFYANRPLMAQPFLEHVVDEGEYSLFYFNGSYSHCVLKSPKDGDFRVQEEHGGLIRSHKPTDQLLNLGNETIASLEETPLYARPDFVRSNDGNTFWLIELELIEPSLYFRNDPNAPTRFAKALDERVSNIL